MLRALGLEDEPMRNALEPLSIMSITWDEGRLRFRQPLKAIAREKYGAPYMTAHRADLHNLLRRAIGDTPLTLGATCVGADTVNGGAVAHFADGTRPKPISSSAPTASAPQSAPSISAPATRALPG